MSVVRTVDDEPPPRAQATELTTRQRLALVVGGALTPQEVLSAEDAALVAKADRVLASAIQRAVLNGEPVDALSADKKAYLKGGALHVPSKSAKGRARRDLSRARKPKPKTRRSR